MAAEKKEMVKFTYQDKEFEAVKSELADYEVNKWFAQGGNYFYAAAERIFDGKDVLYSKLVGGDYDSMVALINAAYAANREAKN